MIAAALSRIAYLRYLLQPGFWRWLVHRIDFLVTDEIRGWVQRPHPAHCHIHPSVSFRSPQNIEFAEHTRVQNHCILWASPKSRIFIGKWSGLGPHTKIFSSNHEFAPGKPYHTQPWREADVIIGEDCWIGAGTIIVAGVTIGDRCVVAAGSVVTKSIPPDSIAAGVPARVIKTRSAPPGSESSS